MEEYICERCRTNMFTVHVISTCKGCKYRIKGHYGECLLGVCYGNGCWILKCTSCGLMSNIPRIEE